MTSPAFAIRVLLVTVGTASLLCGCGETASSANRGAFRAAGDYASLRVVDAEFESVRASANRAFRRVYRVDPDASGLESWVSRPEELAEVNPVRMSDVTNPSSRRHRRIAYLQALPEENYILVRCKVEIQRLETAERTAFARSRNLDGDDRPGDTPIERSGAVSTSTHQDWVTTGRDREGEQALLRAVVAGISRPETDIVTPPAASE